MGDAMTATAEQQGEVTEQGEVTTLYTKLHEVAMAVDSMAKTGHNDHHKYDYVEAAGVLRKIREELLNRKIIVIPSVVADSVKHQPAIGGKGFITTVEVEYRFIDALDPENEITVYWAGAGSDVGGDKGLYKAYTGGLKYALLNLFLIPTGDDPERDETSVSEKGATDDARPAAPEIPQDRARAILAKAVTAGLAEMNGEGSTFKVELQPVLKAKLAEVGVTTGRIGNLNVDQAEDVEAFLTAEAANVNA